MKIIDVLPSILSAMCPGIQKEYRFMAPDRQFRFDFAWPDKKIAFEVEGGTWSKKGKSRHTTGKGYRDDCIKYSEAAIRGWLVIRATTDMLRDGTAVAMLERAFQSKAGESQK